jgi:hypothetical protein
MDSHRKELGFATAFLSFLAKTRLLQHFNDLAKRWLCPFGVLAPTRPSQNRCDKCDESLGKLLF